MGDKKQSDPKGEDAAGIIETQPSGGEALRRLLKQSDFTFEGLYGRKVETVARDILLESGLDPDTPGRWEDPDRPPPEKNSPQEFARRILKHLALIRGNRNANADLALQLAFELGTWCDEADMRFKWGSFVSANMDNWRRFEIERDEKSRKAAAKQRDWQVWAEELWRKNPNLSKRRAATLLKNKHAIDAEPDWIRQVIKKPAK